MFKIITNSFKLCIDELYKKSVIAYPTESVFGLGCDPDSKNAVKKLLKMKKRKVSKGFILIASSYKQFIPYIDNTKISKKQIIIMMNEWYKKNVSFVVPACQNINTLLVGKYHTIAIRIINHKNTKKLCRFFGKPLVSTSANLSGFLPCKTISELKMQFNKKIIILSGNIGNKKKPSEIRDILTGKLIRKG